MKILIATHVEATFEAGFRMLSFGTPPDGSDEYIILQASDEETEEDKALGLTGMHIEINDQSHSGYGCITSIHVSENIIRIEFDADHLGLGRDHTPIEIHALDPSRPFAEAHQMLLAMARSASIKLRPLISSP